MVESKLLALISDQRAFVHRESFIVHREKKTWIVDRLTFIEKGRFLTINEHRSTIIYQRSTNIDQRLND